MKKLIISGLSVPSRLFCCAIARCVTLAISDRARAQQAFDTVLPRAAAISGDRRTLTTVKMTTFGIHVTHTDQGLVNRFSP